MLYRKIVRFWLKSRYQIFSHRYNRLVLEYVEDVPLLVLPQVFNPVLLRTGQFMAQTLSAYPFEGIKMVLDLGTGSGVGAIFAARRGAQVIATDVNPEAVRCVQINAFLNRHERQIEAYQGDLFESVSGQQFDLICFNPPFYQGSPKDRLDHAWRGEGIFECFATQLAQHLTPHGQVLLILSSDGDGLILLQLLREQGYTINIQAQKDLHNEIVTAYQVLKH